MSTPASVATLPWPKKAILNWSRLPFTLRFGTIILSFYLLIALTASLWAPYDAAKTGTGRPFSSPSSDHLLGTDQLGRDIFSRVVLGADDVLFLALTSTLVSTIVGGVMGLMSGLLGGWIDQIIMRFFDAVISIPFLVLALLMIAAAGPDLSGNYWLLILAVVVVYAPRTARMARAVAVDLVTRDFVTVARARGESVLSIVWRELTPNAIGVLLVEFGVRAGYAPIFIGSLSFLGFGVRPPTPEWGLMISENRAAIISAPMSVLAPAAALAVLVIGLNLLTDGLSRVFGRTNKI
ncbi:MAG: ABC transporter permease [Anaerolineae bacterium]